MEIENAIVGLLNTNCYILKKDNKCLVIDPGDETDKIKKIINGTKLIGIIITHYHFDHIGALEQLKKEYTVKVYDYKNMSEGQNNIGPFTFKTIYTPGHKEDLISLYFEDDNVMFCGDFIFNGGIGRYDFKDSSFDDMKKSIKKILSYPNDMIIYPGHGPSTTLENEKEMLKYYLGL